MRNPFRRALPPPPTSVPSPEEALLALKRAEEKRREVDRQARERRRGTDLIVADIIANLTRKGAET